MANEREINRDALMVARSFLAVLLSQIEMLTYGTTNVALKDCTSDLKNSQSALREYFISTE